MFRLESDRQIQRALPGIQLLLRQAEDQIKVQVIKASLASPFHALDDI